MHAGSVRRRRGATLLVASLLATLFPLAPAAVAQTADDGIVEVSANDGLVPSARFAGIDRYDTARLIATDETPFAADFGSESVILARGDAFPDALAGSLLGGAERAPIVLTPSDTSLDDGQLNPDTQAVLDAYENLETVYVLGQTEAIGDDVVEAVEDAFPDVTVERIGGADRFITAAFVGDQVVGDGTADQVIVANAENFPDALVAGAISAAGRVPILLTAEDDLTEITAERLEDYDVDEVLIAGGTDAVNAEVEAEIEAIVGEGNTRRVAGADRFQTAIEFARLGTAEFGFGTDHVNLARADLFPDALALGPHAGLDIGGPAPILLTAPDDLSEQTAAYFEEIDDCSFVALHVAGGIAAIDDDTEREAREALTVEGDACGIDLTPETATNLIGESHTVTATVVSNNGERVAGETVRFDVETTTSGSPETMTAIPESGTATTDDDGEATFTFTSLVAETYTITATVTDDQGVVRTAAATKVFSTEPLTSALTAAGALEHLAAFQSFADANDGTRVSGSAGYDASAAYVAQVAQAAGFLVTLQSFEFLQFLVFDSAFERTAPEPTTYSEDGNSPGFEESGYVPFEYSGSGDVEADTVAVDLGTDAEPSTTSGCEETDFADFPEGAIALMRRGGCTFDTKVSNAENAGAVGAIIYNNTDGALNGTLGEASEVTIPAVGLPQPLGEELRMQAEDMSLRTRVFVLAEERITTTTNVLAETPGGDPNSVVFAGAHLDSVAEGPGIQDNGTGSAALLEFAQEFAATGVQPQNKIRLAWWGAEESGLVGSSFYVGGLREDQLADIALYLNFDMIGSPNFVYSIYDGDQSDFEAPVEVPEGSAQIEAVFERFFSSRDIPSIGSEFNGRSDYQAFIEAGIPAGGLFTGAEGIKTPEQQALFGGAAGIAFDPNYHQAGDTIDNVNLTAFETNLDAIGDALVRFAASTEALGESLDAIRGGGAAPARDTGATNGTKDAPSHLHDAA